MRGNKDTLKVFEKIGEEKFQTWTENWDALFNYDEEDGPSQEFVNGNNANSIIEELKGISQEWYNAWCDKEEREESKCVEAWKELNEGKQLEIITILREKIGGDFKGDIDNWTKDYC